MEFPEDVLSRLVECDTVGYHAGSESATEPAALAAVALIAHGLDERALPHVNWLLGLQQPDGTVGVSSAQKAPFWATGWAVVAWHAARKSDFADERLAPAINRAMAAIVRSQGGVIDRVDQLGHDTTIPGWPWVEGTHSWMEPTAINVLALKHAASSDHPRARDGVRLLEDRLLPTGGANYGNTYVLGQLLRPHLQPTGVALLALAGEPDLTGRIRKSVEFLQDDLSAQTATESLSYGIMGLAAQGFVPDQASDWLAAAAKRTLVRDAAGYKLALLALAALGDTCPLIPPSSASDSP